MGNFPIYEKELTKYARKSLSNLFFFARTGVDTPANNTLANQILELLAFASDQQLNELAKRLYQHPKPTQLIASHYEAFLASTQNPLAVFSKPKRVPSYTIKRNFHKNN
jgi:hypothetical protein